MLSITGEQVKLITQTQVGTDAFNAPIWSETSVTIDNVLIAPSSEQEILDTINLYGKKSIYTLGIPKGDTHDWVNQIVEFWGRRWRTIGDPLRGMEHQIPLSWNTKVRVESIVNE